MRGKYNIEEKFKNQEGREERLKEELLEKEKQLLELTKQVNDSNKQMNSYLDRINK